MGDPYQEGHSNGDIQDKYSEYIMPIWKNLHVPVKKGAESSIADFNGNEYLDLFSGISVTNSGHLEDRVNEAAKNQIDELVHSCSYVHPNEPVANLGEKIAEITPGNLKKSFFCNSGTEAVEGAIKLARKYTGSTEVIAVEMGFHGRTLGSLALTGNKKYKNGMTPTINDVAHISAPYNYRCEKGKEGKCGASCANDLERVITTHTSDDVAAVIIEPVMGEGGIIVPSEEWISRIQEITHRHDALLIADEVQTGYGRTGEMFASEHFDLVPDIITHAKGIANGFPLGAFTARSKVANAFESGDHLSTFGGNPVACAAAIANIRNIQENILDDLGEKGQLLGKKLKEIESNHKNVGDSRGLGLMQGIEIIEAEESKTSGPPSPLPDPERATAVLNNMKEEGIIVGQGGFYNNVIRIQPPLNITVNQLEYATNTLDEVLYDV